MSLTDVLREFQAVVPGSDGQLGVVIVVLVMTVLAWVRVRAAQKEDCAIPMPPPGTNADELTLRAATSVAWAGCYAGVGILALVGVCLPFVLSKHALKHQMGTLGGIDLAGLSCLAFGTAMGFCVLVIKVRLEKETTQ